MRRVSTAAASFSASVDRRDLHSFPTRRSSDLSLKKIKGLEVRVVEAGQADGETDGTRLFGALNNLVPRSEEHTSELQSHVNIVCRLLLEKKNTTSRALVVTEHRPRGRPSE